MMVTWELNHVVKLYPPPYLNTFGLSRSGCMEPPPLPIKLCYNKVLAEITPFPVYTNPFIT